MISSVILKPTTLVGSLVYLERMSDCGFANTKWPLAKKSPAALEIPHPLPTAGFEGVSVPWTLNVSVLAGSPNDTVISSPGVNLTPVVVASPDGISVYWTKSVAGSEAVAATTSRTLAFITDVPPVIVPPTKTLVSVGKSLSAAAVSSFTNS